MDKIQEKNILDFVEKNPSGIIVIYGPTGCGKTGLSIEVAQFLRTLQPSNTPTFQHSNLPTLQAEIISVDARQVYRGLDIGTGKITRGEMRGIPHHMLDVVDITEPFSVVDYRNIVEELEIWKNMKIQLGMVNCELGIDTGENSPVSMVNQRDNGMEPPSKWGLKTIQHSSFPILCGGTGLYIDSLIYERDYMGEKPDTTRRDELEAYRLEHGNLALWDMLHAIDPTYADRLHVNNYTYIIRGIEVFEKTGKSKLEATHGQKLLYPTLFLTPYTDSVENRSTLYTRINERIEKMFSSGLVEETRYILDNLSPGMSLFCNNSHCPGLATIGYTEVIDYLEGHLSLDECISLVQQHNRNYAKRQVTWNKKYEDFRRFTHFCSKGFNE